MSDLGPARKRTIDFLSRLQFLRGWSFEQAPASSGAAQSQYLQAVADSTFFVWLVAAETTPAVQREVRVAKDCGARILAFILPATERSSDTLRAIAEVRDVARSKDVNSVEDLIPELEAAIGEEIADALLGRMTFARNARLTRMALASHARVIERMRRFGVSAEDALEIASTQANLDGLLPTPEQRLRLIVAELGSGKSHASELIYQHAVNAALQSENAPIPLHMAASDTSLYLDRDVLARTPAELRPSLAAGTFLVIDALDEVRDRAPAEVLIAARAYIRADPMAHVVITSRPSRDVASKPPECVELPRLTDDEALALVARVAGQERSPSFYGLPSALIDACHRPLFAILYGRDLRTRDPLRSPVSMAALLREMVQDAIGPSAAEAIATLAPIAAGLVTSGVDDVDPREVGGFASVAGAERSRLVENANGRLRFALRIVREWFAAEQLIREPALLDTILETRSARDRWQTPLGLALTGTSVERGAAILDRVIRADPGLAALVVTDSVAERSFDETPAALPARAYGEQLHRAFASWGAGLGSAAPALLPVDAAGDPLPIGVASTPDSPWILVATRPRVIQGAAVVDMTGRVSHDAWMRLSSFRVGSDPLWPWRWPLEDASRHADELVKARMFGAAASSAWRQEMAWSVGRDLARTLRLDELRVSAIKPLLQTLGEWAFVGRFPHARDLRPLRTVVAAVESEGRDEIPAPWPEADLDWSRGQWSWSPYSPPRLLERTIAVYTGAMEIYSALVSENLSGLAPRLAHAELFPARLVGHLWPVDASDPESGFPGKSPTLVWYFEPLALGTANEVAIDLMEVSGQPRWLDNTEQEAIIDRYRALRPDLTRYGGVAMSALGFELFDEAPATDLAYKWLADDLKAIHLLR